jgi:hypothetical protein
MNDQDVGGVSGCSPKSLSEYSNLLPREDTPTNS